MKRNKSCGGLIVASALLLPAQIFAENMLPTLAPGFYAGGDVRAVIIENTSLRQFGGPATGTVKFDPGAGIAIRGGFRFCEWFALEGETGASGNSIRSITGAS